MVYLEDVHSIKSSVVYKCIIILEIFYTFSHGAGFNEPRDFAKQPRLELAGKHVEVAIFVLRKAVKIGTLRGQLKLKFQQFRKFVENIF